MLLLQILSFSEFSQDIALWKNKCIVQGLAIFHINKWALNVYNNEAKVAATSLFQVNQVVALLCSFNMNKRGCHVTARSFLLQQSEQ